jgi:hypothetical protein
MGIDPESEEAAITSASEKRLPRANIDEWLAEMQRKLLTALGGAVILISSPPFQVPPPF